MLRDGKFIKEPPPKIGAMYEMSKQKQYSYEEEQWQHALLEKDNHTDLQRIVDKFVNKYLHR
jgi:hypothetical protein